MLVGNCQLIYGQSDPVLAKIFSLGALSADKADVLVYIACLFVVIIKMRQMMMIR